MIKTNIPCDCMEYRGRYHQCSFCWSENSPEENYELINTRKTICPYNEIDALRDRCSKVEKILAAKEIEIYTLEIDLDVSRRMLQSGEE